MIDVTMKTRATRGIFSLPDEIMYRLPDCKRLEYAAVHTLKRVQGGQVDDITHVIVNFATRDENEEYIYLFADAYGIEILDVKPFPDERMAQC